MSLVCNQWTQFRGFPGFMKKVENVDQEAALGEPDTATRDRPPPGELTDD